MNCACELFYKILPNDAATVQAWAALITTGIAGYALMSWKNQKHYDIYLQAISNYSYHGPLVNKIVLDIIDVINKTDNLLDLNNKILKIIIKNGEHVSEFLKIARTIELIEGGYFSVKSKDVTKIKELYKFYEKSLSYSQSKAYNFSKMLLEEENQQNIDNAKKLLEKELFKLSEEINRKLRAFNNSVS